MTRWYLILVFLPVFGRAQKFSAADIRQLKLYSTGFFSGKAQVGEDTGFTPAGLQVQPVWPTRKDGSWMFTDRTDTAHYYQVWHFYLQDDTTLVMQFFDFKEMQKATLLSQDIKQQSSLYLYNLFTRHGCEVYLKKNKTGYSGHSAGKDCFANMPGAEYALFNIAITKNTIYLQQSVFDKENKEIAVKGNTSFRFLKQAKSLK